MKPRELKVTIDVDGSKLDSAMRKLNGMLNGMIEKYGRYLILTAYADRAKVELSDIRVEIDRREEFLGDRDTAVDSINADFKEGRIK